MVASISIDFDEESQKILRSHRRIYPLDGKMASMFPGTVLLLIDMRKHREQIPHKASIIEGAERFCEIGMMSFVDEVFSDVPIKDRYFMMLYPVMTREALAANKLVIPTFYPNVADELDAHVNKPWSAPAGVNRGFVLDKI